MTISEAAQVVLKNAGKSMTIQEIYKEIIEKDLYSFGAKDPKSVLASSIRKNSDASPTAKRVIFKSAGKGHYELAE